MKKLVRKKQFQINHASHLKTKLYQNCLKDMLSQPLTLIKLGNPYSYFLLYSDSLLIQYDSNEVITRRVESTIFWDIDIYKTNDSQTCYTKA